MLIVLIIWLFIVFKPDLTCLFCSYMTWVTSTCILVCFFHDVAVVALSLTGHLTVQLWC